MVVSSFFIIEDHTDFKEWFIRCVDGKVRDAFCYDFSSDSATKEAVQIVLREHNKSCAHCVLTEQGADLEIRSVLDDLDDLDDIECSDNVLPALLVALGLQKSDTRYVFGDISASNLKARCLVTFALIEPYGDAISSMVSNVQLLSYLDALYTMSEHAERLNREICWIEYPPV